MADDRGNTPTSMTDQDLTFAASSSLPAAGGQNEMILKSLMAGSGTGMPATNSGLTFAPHPITPTPPPVYQSPEGAFKISQGPFGTVGERKRADKQALFGGIAQMISSVNKYEQEKKTRNVQMDIERLMSAFEGRKEAQASGDKDAFLKNSQIINDITSDKKKRKELEKAFNVSLLPNDKNNKNAAQNKAFLQAWAEYDKKKQSDPSTLNPSAERLLQGQPVRQGIDPRLQFEAEMVKAGLQPNANVALAEAGKNLRSYTTAQTAQEKMALADKMTHDLIQAKKYGMDKQYEAALIKTAGLETAARIHASAGIQMEREKTQAMLEVADARIRAMRDIAGDKLEVDALKAKAEIASREKIAKLKSDTEKYITEHKDLTTEKVAELRAKTQKDIAILNNKTKLQYQNLGSVAKDYSSTLAKIKENDSKIASIQKQIEATPGMFSAFNPFSKGYGGGAYFKNKKLLNDLSIDMHAAQMENRMLNDRLEGLEKKRHTMEQLNMLPLPDTSNADGSNEVQDVSGDAFFKAPESGGGDINVNIDLSGGGDAGDSDK